MPDRDSVINDLVERIEATLAVDSEWVNMPLDLVQYALHLLKEQEPVNQYAQNMTKPLCCSHAVTVKRSCCMDNATAICAEGQLNGNEGRNRMKKFWKLIVAVTVATCLLVLLCSCDAPSHTTGNRITTGKDVQTFNYAYILLDGKEVVSGAVTQWRDYEYSDVVQVLIGGKYYLTHYSNVIMVADPEKGSLGYDSGWVDHN